MKYLNALPIALALASIFLVSGLVLQVSKAEIDSEKNVIQEVEHALFAGGCFWCM